MIKLLGAIALIGTAWAGSQYLTTSRDVLDGRAVLPARTTAATMPEAHSVALLDLAVAVLPHASSAPAESVPVAAADVAATPAAIETAAQTAETSPEPADSEAEADLARRLQVPRRPVQPQQLALATHTQGDITGIHPRPLLSHRARPLFF